MKLIELQPRFLRYEKRLDTWTEVDRQPGPGETAATVPHHVVTAMRAFWPFADGIEDAMGIEFLCPKCFVANGGPVGTHAVICWSSSRGVPGRWRLVGTGFNDLSLMEEPGKSRSVLLLGGCAWHGFVTNGEVT